MKNLQTQFRSTVARPSDYTLVARLCRRAVGPGDYVLSILREAINRRGLFLAWNDEELVGMTNFERCIDESGWLSMARTDPDWRRSGVALFLQRQIAAQANQRGIGLLRLWTLSKNKPSIRACMKGGFRPVCEATHVSCRLRAKGRNSAIRPASSSSDITVESFLRSTYLSKMNGYLAYKWHFVKASGRLLEQLLRRSELYRVGESDFILTRPERSFRRQTSFFTILSGPMSSSLRSIRQIGKALGAQAIGGYIPYEPYLLRAGRELGFKRDPWAKHCVVFEKESH